ncbi:MAG: 5-(carboxyamino)imidazole ribonucleotide synthase, partial [Betaproteobacteria bacterium]|nr:5-(carboxyamino)imidazole ribonucleotide synthase [Betaproteobacteria bacterium]
QFEQQVRSLCGLPLGDTRLLAPVVMVNLLGEAWQQGQPQWESVFRLPEAKLHLYGKHDPRPGRKMGHFTVLGASPDDALQKALAIRAELCPAFALEPA